MKALKLARAFLWILGSLSVLAAFAILDWYPTLKDLGRLRRERGDLERKIKDYGAMASGFTFPDRNEKSLFAREKINLRRALLQAYDDDAWTALVLLELQARAREDRIPFASFLFNWQLVAPELGTTGPGGADLLTGWIDRQFADIQGGFSIAFDTARFPWNGVLSGMQFRRGRLASRPVCVVAMAPLPALLDFINHLSWGETRFEIIRLRLEPGMPFSRAWLVCRGNYLARKTSKWTVEKRNESAGDGLLVDTDSPLLLQKAEPFLAPRVKKEDLPPMGSPW
ncbi:MAG: hypothetical protein E4H23_04155 [Chrysiogenales bacterium]|nr:MAG: hypothetical protein E4H23_04155 [Chrysiogenales bacterium]